jgi:hypothetical protein
MSTYDWSDYQNFDPKDYQQSQESLHKVEGFIQRKLEAHHKLVDATLEERLALTLASGLSQGEHTLNTSLLSHNEDNASDKTEWMHKGVLIMTSWTPKFEVRGDDQGWVTEGVIL